MMFSCWKKILERIKTILFLLTLAHMLVFLIESVALMSPVYVSDVFHCCLDHLPDFVCPGHGFCETLVPLVVWNSCTTCQSRLSVIHSMGSSRKNWGLFYGYVRERAEGLGSRSGCGHRKDSSACSRNCPQRSRTLYSCGPCTYSVPSPGLGFG